MSDEALLIKDAASKLGVGSTTLFRILREKGLIGNTNNLPRHDLVTAGIFKTEVRSYTRGKTDRSWGTKKPYTVTLVTALGITYLQDIVTKYLAEQQQKEATA